MFKNWNGWFHYIFNRGLVPIFKNPVEVKAKNPIPSIMSAMKLNCEEYEKNLGILEN